MARQPSGQLTFMQVLSAALNDFEEHGYQSEEQLQNWLNRLRAAAIRSLTPEAQMIAAMRKMYVATYRSQVEDGAALRRMPGVSRYNPLAKLRPELKAELDRRIMSSASLIRMNREEEISATMRRFAGLVTSIPAGGTDDIGRKKAKEHIRKSVRSLPFRERRVLIDQNAKMVSNIQAIVAQGNGAIAGRWHSHWKQANYDYREDHKERDQTVYVVRDSWAAKDGFIKPTGKTFYTDQITQPAEEPFCRCYFEWIFHLRDMPRDYLTKKGEEALKAARAAIGG